MAIKIHEQQVGLSAGPTVRQRLRPVEEQALQGLGQAISTAGTQVTNVVLKERAKQDNAILNDAETKLIKLQQAARERMRSMKGEDALKGEKGVSDWYKGEADKVASELPHDRHREVFHNTKERYGTRFRGAHHNYLTQQGEAVAESKFQGTLAAMSADILEFASNGDIERMRDVMDDYRLKISARADELGIPTDGRPVFEQEMSGQMHAAVIGGMLEKGEFEQAEEHLEQYGARMDTANRERARDSITKIGKIERGRRIALRVVKDYTSEDGMFVDYDDAMLEINNSDEIAKLGVQAYEEAVGQLQAANSRSAQVRNAHDIGTLNDVKNRILTGRSWRKMLPKMTDEGQWKALLFAKQARSSNRANRNEDWRYWFDTYRAIPERHRVRLDLENAAEFTEAPKWVRRRLMGTQNYERRNDGANRQEAQAIAARRMDETWTDHTESDVKTMTDMLMAELAQRDQDIRAEGLPKTDEITDFVDKVTANIEDAGWAWFDKNVLDMDEEQKADHFRQMAEELGYEAVPRIFRRYVPTPERRDPEPVGYKWRGKTKNIEKVNQMSAETRRHMENVISASRNWRAHFESIKGTPKYDEDLIKIHNDPPDVFGL